MTNGLTEKPAPLNRAPDGLLGFLGIKNGGKNPQFMVPYVQPVFDLYEHYLNTAPEYSYITATVNATGDTIYLLANPGEVLYVSEFSVSASAAAGEAIRYALSRGRQNVGATRLTDVLNVPASTFDGRACIKSLWLMPDEWIGISTFSITGAVDTYFGARFVRCPM